MADIERVTGPRTPFEHIRATFERASANLDTAFEASHQDEIAELAAIDAGPAREEPPIDPDIELEDSYWSNYNA